MKATVVLISILTFITTQVSASNYILKIDGNDVDIDLDQETTVSLSSGQKIKLTLSQKDIVLFKTPAFSFEHKRTLSPSRTKIDEGIYQTMLASPRGTTIMLQELHSINPTGLVDTMLKELTKEEVQYGYKYSEEAIQQVLSNGKKLTGKKAITTYRNDKWIRCVLCYELRDAGILIVTMIEEENLKEEADIIHQFWKSLNLTLE